MRHTMNEIEKSFDVLKEAFEDVSECTGCYAEAIHAKTARRDSCGSVV